MYTCCYTGLSHHHISLTRVIYIAGRILTSLHYFYGTDLREAIDSRRILHIRSEILKIKQDKRLHNDLQQDVIEAEQFVSSTLQLYSVLYMFSWANI